MGKLNRKTPVVFYVGVVLLGLWLISSHLMGGLYARYSSSVSGSDSARVAGFSVSVNAEGQDLDLDLDMSSASGPIADNFKFEVENNSEVKVSYTVKVSLNDTLPNGVTLSAWAVNALGETVDMVATESDGVYLYSSELDFTDSHTWTLTFTGDPETVEEAKVLSGITVDIDAVQID